MLARKRYGKTKKEYLVERYSKHFTKGKIYEVVGRDIYTDSDVDVFALDKEGNWDCVYMDEYRPKNIVGGTILC